MNKTAIKNFAIEARKKLISEITYRAGLVGITKNGIVEPIHKADGIEMYNIGASDPYTIKGEQLKQRKSLASRVKEKGFDNVIEEVAYTWFNRIIAVRFMEVNDYLPTRVRVLSSETAGKIEPDIVTEAPNIDLGFTSVNIDEILQLKHDNKLDELFRMLFIMQCNSLNSILPELFEKQADYSELLFDTSFTNQDSIVRILLENIEEEDFKEIEIIGWMYQYYNSEEKDRVINAKQKYRKEEIPYATQLFTPDWIVKYMVQNSLGRYWVENHPEDKELKDNWEFFLVNSECNENNKELDAFLQPGIKVEDIKCFEPAMGSGHILIYIFDVLFEIYKKRGYADREIPKLILQNNLYGLEIDIRAYQLAHFALIMKARSKSRRFFDELSNFTMNLAYFRNSETINDELIKFFIQNSDISFDEIKQLMSEHQNSDELGSLLIQDTYIDFEKYQKRLKEILETQYDNLFDFSYKEAVIDHLAPIIKQASILAQKYDITVTNPPYMGSKYMNNRISDYVHKNYKEYKSDLFSCFLKMCMDKTNTNGQLGFLTPYVWMFIQSYENLRNSIVNDKTISTLTQLEYNAFPEACVPVCIFTLRNYLASIEGQYIKLSDFKGSENQSVRTLEAIEDANVYYRYSVKQDSFSKIPGMPIAYWVSENFIKVFSNENIYKYSVSASQNVTGNNEKYLRFFWEIRTHEVGRGKKWIFYAKGGGYRKWYGNMIDVINWTPQAREEYRKGHASQIVPENYWYKKGITWGLITSNFPSFRILPVDSTFDKGGSSIFINDDEKYNYILGLLNSKVFFNVAIVFNPTMNFQVKDIRTMPVVFRQADKINILVNNLLLISKTDWDSFEISWDFMSHPLIRFKIGSTKLRIEDAFIEWQDFTEQQFAQLKVNEEELNGIFIDTYGLQDELTPEVEERDITIRKADLERDIKSFISYAVGCMFGRYSLDMDGLTYAGGEWDSSKYKTFLPDADNVIPVADEEYFNDDMVGRFVEFVKVAFSADTLEENLDFIANAISNKGNNSREVIRQYFIKDFYKDHVKTYQKKPIYWLFDSGKENGFKALIYMHRYNQDTVGRVRADYLHKTQKAIENAISRADMVIDSSANPSQKTKAVKEKEKLAKQLAETRFYDAAIGHVAAQRISIDLDDGITVNYAKFQGVEVSSEGKKASKIDLLGKI